MKFNIGWSSKMEIAHVVPLLKIYTLCIHVMAMARLLSMFSILTTRCMRWLGHVIRMYYGRIHKDLLFGELATGGRLIGRLALRYKDVCKRDLKIGQFNSSDLDTTAVDCICWRATTRDIVKAGKKQTRWHRKHLRKRLQAGAAPPRQTQGREWCGLNPSKSGY